MTIKFQSIVHPVDNYCGMAFTTILNLLVLSSDVVELNRCLSMHDAANPWMRLSGYFLWEYTGSNFRVWQRMGYGCPDCFPTKIFELSYPELIKPRVKGN